MLYSSAEDRLNPVAPEGADESTFGGYAAVYGRAPAFEGSDGQPYTAAVDAEPADDGNGWVAYLVFLRWAANGGAVMGHLESADLARAPTEAQVRTTLEAMPLQQVRAILENLISTRNPD